MSAAVDVPKPSFFSVGAKARARPLLLLITALVALRVVTAAYLPLSFDEAYFWLWSRHLAISYFEHPPLIAIAIRAGTALLGDTSLGVRLLSIVASLAASWAVWRVADRVLARKHAWTSCAFFNLTLMVASQGIAATPDIFVMAACAFLLFSVVELEATQDGRWWLLAASALSCALLSKYTAFFLALALCLWLVLWPQGRRWLKTPWPYAAAALALVSLSPNLVWNAAHGWMSFRYQFGRVVAGGLTPQHLLEFLGGQIALTSPFIFALAAVGLIGETRAWQKSQLTMVLALVWPAVLYFCVHSLHDRVQGNWPSFIYPGLAILAASAVPRVTQNRRVAWLSRLSIPCAALVLVVCYVQALTGILPLGKSDPIARMTAVGFEPVAKDISALAEAEQVSALVTTRYVNTGWLAFYVHPGLPVLQDAEEYRWTDAPVASKDLLQEPLLYVTQHPERELRFVSRDFSQVTFEACVPRRWGGVTVETFCLYKLAGFRDRQAGNQIPVAYQPPPSVPRFGALRPAVR